MSKDLISLFKQDPKSRILQAVLVARCRDIPPEFKTQTELLEWVDTKAGKKTEVAEDVAEPTPVDVPVLLPTVTLSDGVTYDPNVNQVIISVPIMIDVSRAVTQFGSYTGYEEVIVSADRFLEMSGGDILRLARDQASAEDGDIHWNDLDPDDTNDWTEDDTVADPEDELDLVAAEEALRDLLEPEEDDDE